MSIANEETVWSASLAEFRDATASAEPTPGGGSVAAVSATLGLGLVIMALEISIRRKDAVQVEEAKSLIENARTLMGSLGGDADDDIRAFGAYMAALKLPKESEEEKAQRKSALRAATHRATEVPLLAADHIVQALRLAAEALPLAHAHVASDVGACAGLLEGALKAVLLNVDVNLPSVSDAAKKAAWALERAALEKQGVELASEVFNALPGRVPPSH
jgi:formiminotetrahydrofolate cyclodeaminase